MGYEEAIRLHGKAFCIISVLNEQKETDCYNFFSDMHHQKKKKKGKKRNDISEMIIIFMLLGRKTIGTTRLQKEHFAGYI